jgi:hypothetical protein
MNKLFEKQPAHYPPKSIAEVDFGYDERNPWLRSIRQNMPMIKCFIVFIFIAWTYAYFEQSFVAILTASLITILFSYLLYAEKRDDEQIGHLRPNEYGDYWRARKEYLKSIESERED